MAHTVRKIVVGTSSPTTRVLGPARLRMFVTGRTSEKRASQLKIFPPAAHYQQRSGLEHDFNYCKGPARED